MGWRIFFFHCGSKTVESLFLGSKTFLLGLELDEILISFFLQNHKKTINFCWKWNPKSHHPHIQIERSINKSHPNVLEEDQDWRHNTYSKQTRPNAFSSQQHLYFKCRIQKCITLIRSLATSNIVPPFKNYLLQKKALQSWRVQLVNNKKK